MCHLFIQPKTGVGYSGQTTALARQIVSWAEGNGIEGLTIVRGGAGYVALGFGGGPEVRENHRAAFQQAFTASFPGGGAYVFSTAAPSGAGAGAAMTAAAA